MACTAIYYTLIAVAFLQGGKYVFTLFECIIDSALFTTSYLLTNHQ